MQYITIMTEEEHNMYRDFQRQRATLEANVTKGYDDLLVEHLRLCSAVSCALGEGAAFQKQGDNLVQRFIVRSQSAAERAIKLAKRALEP